MSKRSSGRKRNTVKHNLAVSLLVFGALGIIGILIFLASNPTPHP